VLTLFDLLGLTMAKLWYLKNNPIYMAIGMLSFALATLAIGFSLKYQGLAIINIIWMALSAITVTIAGYYFFKEPIAPYQFVGIFIILIGLTIIQWK
jgi:multidrug transporter EmrE-like cation transporter